MTLRRLSACLLLLVAACGSAAERLEGAWVMDVATLNFSPTFRSLSAEGQEAVVRRTRFNLTFEKGTLAWDHAMWGWGSDKWKAPYEVKEVEGNRVKIELLFAAEREEDAPDPKAARLAQQLRKNRTLTFVLKGEKLQFSLGGRSIVCRRK